MSDDTINLKELGLTHAQALCALFNAARTQGMGALHYKPRNMDEAEAAQLLEERKADPYFDYHEGRVMKVKIKDEINPRLYDLDNGYGAALAALGRYAASKTAA